MQFLKCMLRTKQELVLGEKSMQHYMVKGYEQT